MLRPHFLFVMLSLGIAVLGSALLAAEPPADAKPSVTVFPVAVTPEAPPAEMAKRIGVLVATFLERSGLEKLEVAETAFDPPKTGDVQTMAEAFGQHVVAHPIKTDYAVFAQFEGTPATGVKAIRTIVVDAAGKIVLAEAASGEQLAGAAVPPKDIMTCSLFVGSRLQALWKLQDPLRSDAPQGAMARFWQEDAGVPDREELDAIEVRGATLKANIRSATCTVYPVRVGPRTDKQCAAELVALLAEAGVGEARVSETDPALVIQPHSNEQKVLWDTARAFRAFLQKSPPATDYAAYADYGIADSAVHHVHVVVCNRAGEWVLIDMQNSHHPDFERIDPKSAADCNRLVVERLKAWMGE